MSEEDKQPSLVVYMKREPFIDFFQLFYEDGNTDREPDVELDPEETRDWFRARGANMDAIEVALDDCWNFYTSVVAIKNPKNPPVAVAEPDV